MPQISSERIIYRNEVVAAVRDSGWGKKIADNSNIVSDGTKSLSCDVIITNMKVLRDIIQWHLWSGDLIKQFSSKIIITKNKK